MLFDQEALYKLNEIGIALSKERHLPALLEKILVSAKELTGADGGTIYTVTPQKTLHFEIAISDSLGFHAGGAQDLPIPFSDLPLYLENNRPNDHLMVAYAVNHKKTINIQDAYREQGFDFSGTRRFDEKTGYRTKAVLTIPIKNHEEDIVAVLQLINPKNGQFSDDDIQLAESLASQAGLALTNHFLIASLTKLFDSLIHMIAETIDEKSPSTGNHGKRVPIVARLLAENVNQAAEPPFEKVHFTEEQLYELEVAAFLHDCGKLTVPEYVLEKGSKLETILDRIEWINTRFLALEERLEKELLLKKLRWFETHYPRAFDEQHAAFSHEEKEFYERLKKSREDLEFIQRCNLGKEPITPEAKTRLSEIADESYSKDHPLLTPSELESLSVASGNLTLKERKMIEHHVVMTYRMLSKLNYPKDLAQVAEIAASHHEWVNGKGYPRGLKKEEISLQGRILAIADVFEALSAPDRPYKVALPLSEVFKIMQRMVDEGHIDPDLYALFIHNKAYLPYASHYLAPEQIDI